MSHFAQQWSAWRLPPLGTAALGCLSGAQLAAALSFTGKSDSFGLKPASGRVFSRGEPDACRCHPIMEIGKSHAHQFTVQSSVEGGSLGNGGAETGEG